MAKMKIFLDKGKTLLPRVDSVLLLSRLMIVLAVGALPFQQKLNRYETILLSILAITFLVQLIIFLVLMKREKYDLKKAYFVIIIYEMVLIPVMIHFSGGFASNYYLFYCLTAIFSAYMLTLPISLSISGLISAIYIVLVYDDLQVSTAPQILMRIGFIWFLSLAVSFVFNYIRRSENRLLKLFDTLNQRTSELERSQAHLELIYENTRVLAGILDVDGVIEEVMRITGQLMSYPASGILLKGPGDNFIYRGRDIAGQSNFHLKAADSGANQLILRVARLGEAITVKDVNGRADYKPLRPTTHSIMIVPMVAHGKTIGVLTAESSKVGAFGDKDQNMLTVVARAAAMSLENAMLHHKMEELTVTDELTGIYNYRYFAEKLKEEQRRAARYDLPLSLIMLDIDWFKRFNDTYGHEVGNIVLKGITSVVKRCIRDVDIFCRYGGEEFVIILPQTPQIEVTRIGERIREQVDASNFGGGDNIPGLKVTVSVGISSFPENGKPNEELLSIADTALYRAKGSGKNKVCVI
jgi:diguanylate cyclase (GGDEF)-like protein